jgi:hypothetical protein
VKQSTQIKKAQLLNVSPVQHQTLTNGQMKKSGKFNIFYVNKKRLIIDQSNVT